MYVKFSSDVLSLRYLGLQWKNPTSSYRFAALFVIDEITCESETLIAYC